MQPFSAIVKNGRLTLDEPCAFAEGEVVILLPLNELLASAADGDGDAGDDVGNIMFELSTAPATPRHYRKPEAITAASLLKELRSI